MKVDTVVKILLSDFKQKHIVEGKLKEIFEHCTIVHRKLAKCISN